VDSKDTGPSPSACGIFEREFEREYLMMVINKGKLNKAETTLH
jgi:hypothetical protein